MTRSSPSSAHGVADLAAQVPLTTEHRFRIASHSKTFTATAIVQLAAEGRLRLDDTLGERLPELAGTALGAVTLRELLAHGGGVIRDGWDGDHWQLVRPFPDAATLRRIATDDAAVLGRNERFKYSNIGFALLGAVVEAVTGRGYADHVRRGAAASRSGLAATTPEIDLADAADVAGHATGYTSLAYAPVRVPFDHIATGAMAAATGFSLHGLRPRALGGGPLPRATSASCATTPSARCSAPSGRSGAAAASTASASASPRSASAGCSATAAGSPASSRAPGSTRSTGSPSPCSPTPSTARP